MLYLSCGQGTGPGRVYQVDQSGRVLGLVLFRPRPPGSPCTSRAAWCCPIPRDGGQLVRIDDTGKVSTIVSHNIEIPHPCDVGIAGSSDMVVVADNLNGSLEATTALGGQVQLYRRVGTRSSDMPRMSVAVTLDRHVILGSDRPEGIYRFLGTEPARGPVLPGSGGVAADPSRSAGRPRRAAT